MRCNCRLPTAAPMSTAGIDPAGTAGTPSAPDSPGANQNPADFKGQQVEVVNSNQQASDAGEPVAIDQWKLINEEASSLQDGDAALTFDVDPDDAQPLPAQQKPSERTAGPAAALPASEVAARNATVASGTPSQPQTPAVSSAEISQSVNQAKRGGILGAIISLVNVIKNFFLPAAVSAAGTSASENQPNSSLWMQAVAKFQDALATVPETRSRITNETAELTGEVPELQEALSKKGDHPVKKIIDPAQALEALKNKRLALDALAAHPDLATDRREKLAGNIQTAAKVIANVMETRYAPVTEELRPLEKSSLRAFGIPGGGNPYVDMSSNKQLFSSVEDRNVRNWLANALEILDAAGRLLVDSAAGRDSDVDVGELQRQFKSFERESAAQKSFAHASLLAATQDAD